MKIKIIEVQDKKELKQFINLPVDIYKNDQNWVNTISLIDKKIFTDIGYKNYKLFLAFKNDRLAGRLAAFVDDNYESTWPEENMGFWGSFETVYDYEVAEKLFESAEHFLRQLNKSAMRGPWNFISQSIGFLRDNFYSPPVALSPYNPPYYVNFAEKYGFFVEKRLTSYLLDGRWGYEIPERFSKWYDKIKQKYKVKLRFVRVKDIKKEIATVVDISNRSYTNYWGYAQVSQEEADEIAKILKPVINDKCVLLAEVNDTAIGFSIAFPDFYIPLRESKGKFFPSGIFKLMKFLKNPTYYRLWALGVCPEYQKKAIDVLLYLDIYKSLSSDRVILEPNWVFDDNKSMVSTIKHLDAKVFRKYKIFRKNI